MSLPNLIQEKYDAALNSKDLLFFETTKINKNVDGVEFEITYAPSLAKKPESDPTVEEKKKIKVNPFLPPHPTLYVQDIGEEHSVVLNKFCVVPRHIILVTKEFKSQSQPLFPGDLLAAWQCMMTAFGTTPALVFYNCGPFSGASQPHKHLQIVPLQGQNPQPPIKALFNQIRDRKAGQIYVLENLPFVHVITPLDRSFIDSSTDNEEIADYLAQMFFGLLDAMFQQLRKHATPDREISYNFIMTDQFMMIIPRSRELATLSQENLQVSINSLGFAGMLLVKTPEELASLEKHSDLMQVLKNVGYAWNPDADMEDSIEQ
ncbi:ATP adenylyltransferase-domain-containing protein [Phascolomyces articulosus]|uniref:ATP adenylyltransferase-domain-containing protein n=1 Tax=Phascolomyces articulosus TaxID=60185 RepID=A0AAD5K703_9FUNG|nr:ATP adenylyltransferase-domain-containing protein [Phascolomyces articulosus]